MSPRRHQTALSEDQPVKFYKVIAFTFFGLAVIVLLVIGFTSAKRAAITIETKAEPIDVSGVATISPDQAAGVWLGVVTSTPVSLSLVAQPSGGREEDAVATGNVTLRNDTGAAQTLIPTTRLLTADGEKNGPFR